MDNNLSKLLTVITILLVAMLFVQIISLTKNPVSETSEECKAAQTYAEDVISKVNSTAEMREFKSASQSWGDKVYEGLAYKSDSYIIFSFLSIVEQQQAIIGLLQHCSN